MARVARLSGALLVETQGSHYLVGQIKAPCDFTAAGFAASARSPSVDEPYVKLEAAGRVVLPPPWLSVELEGEPLAQALAERMLIERNASVSERLWRLVAGADAEGEIAGDAVAARWLFEVPLPVWNLVREQVLRCL